VWAIEKDKGCRLEGVLSKKGQNCGPEDSWSRRLEENMVCTYRWRRERGVG
jgi:hypothetical protein